MGCSLTSRLWYKYSQLFPLQSNFTSPLPPGSAVQLSSPSLTGSLTPSWFNRFVFLSFISSPAMQIRAFIFVCLALSLHTFAAPVPANPDSALEVRQRPANPPARQPPPQQGPPPPPPPPTNQGQQRPPPPPRADLEIRQRPASPPARPPPPQQGPPPPSPPPANQGQQRPPPPPRADLEMRQQPARPGARPPPPQPGPPPPPAPPANQGRPRPPPPSRAVSFEPDLQACIRS
ncbi:hypothetical protein MVEN_02121600 [Mycena venus]|uniref:Uncharacterized protein n=1 Tax=Mycena venus TaxID=2733690 RepID=A0A8H7CIQ1_9AGAR|nr:hypothetical protein MVEN_02121600 [Mycena venus]